MHFKIFFISLLIILFQIFFTNADVVDVNGDNWANILKDNEVVLVNFYADWCRFSQMLAPIFQDAAIKVKEKFPEQGKVVFAKVDCEREGNIASAYQVSKYPTLKIFRFGQVMKKEYRGQRSSQAFIDFIEDQLKTPIKIVTSLEEIEELDHSKRHVVGYFDSNSSPDYEIFKKLAAVLKGECEFVSISGPACEREIVAGNKMVFKPSGENPIDMMYPSPLVDYQAMFKWTGDKCLPLVRQITFENAEELTEEGLPFLILFHHPDDHESPEKFKDFVVRDLYTERNGINFLTADGIKFTHPLHHLGKGLQDLPVIAIDSFKHMYLWNKNVKQDLETKGLLLQFINDLKSGKLHREFHNGPDPEIVHEITIETHDSPPSNHIPHEKVEEKQNKQQPHQTQPPESLFKKLAPSRSRYTILKDEL